MTNRASLSGLFLAFFLTLACSVTQLPAAGQAEDNWPAWRGPLANGTAPKAEPPVTWSEQSNIKWKVKIPGGGSSTPIVWDDKVFVQTAVPTGRKVEAAAAIADKDAAGAGRRPGGGPKPTEVCRFVILCLERASGKTLWEQTVREEVPHEGHHATDGTFASSSPVTDGKLVFAYFGSRGLKAYDLEGKEKWSKNLGRMQIKMGFGEGSSPALYKDTLVVNWDNETNSFIAAFNKSSGKELWRQARDEATSWATPLVVEYDGKPQVVTSATKKIRSYDLATGKLIWECSGMTANVIPCPVSADDLVYAISGFRGSALLAIKLGRTGDLTGTDAIVWRQNKNTPYVPSPLLYDGALYFFSGNTPALSCVDAKSGETLINAEKIEPLQSVYASPVGAGGRVYLLGRNGTGVVIKKSGKVEILATNTLEEKFDASPAVAGKELFLRGREFLYCIAEK